MSGLSVDATALLGLGRDATSLTFLQISLRGVIVFFAALVIVRCGDRRFLSQKTAFDAVLGFILASMLARAVNGTAAFLPTLGGGFVLVMLHRALAVLGAAVARLRQRHQGTKRCADSGRPSGRGAREAPPDHHS